MRTLLAALTALMLFAATPASTAELKPLSEVLSGEDSPYMAVYALTRCAGLYMILGALFDDAAPDQAKVLMKTATTAMLVAYKLNKSVDDAGLNKNVTLESIQDQALRIGKLYNDRWVSNQDATGHGSDAFFKAETELCRLLVGAVPSLFTE